MRARVIAAGAAAPDGMNALQAAMAARAGMRAPRSSPFRDRRGIPIAVCSCDWIDDTTVGQARRLALLTRAVAPIAGRIRPGTPLVLAVRDDDPAAGASLFDAFVTALRGRIGARASTLLPGGAAAMAYAIEHAASLLEGGAAEVAVACVDSLFDARALAALDADRRLRSDAAEEALVPSEGAAVLLLGAPDAGTGARITAIAVGDEDDDPDIGRVWTSLVRRVGSASVTPAREAVPVPWVLTNVNGERHRVRPWNMVRERVGDVLAEQVVEDHAGDLFGDAGVATAGLVVATCIERWRTSCAPGGAAIVALASEGRERGALLLAWDGAAGEAMFTASVDFARARRSSRGVPLPPVPVVAAHLRAMARERAEDIGAMGVLRVPGRGQGWRTAEPFEERLLASFDALSALGEAGRLALDPAAYVRAYGSDRLTPDPARAFAMSFVLGSFDHPEAAAWIAEAVEADPPDLRAAHADALALAARPGLGEALAARMTGPAAAIAIDVQRRRREVTYARCLAMLDHTDPGVAAAAARALAHVPAGEAKVARAMLEELVARTPPPEIEVAAVESLARLGSPLGAEMARARLQAAIEAPPADPRVVRGACRLLAAVGSPADADLLARASETFVPALTALGWLGDRRHVELLLDRLEVLGEAARAGLRSPALDVAQALARITGLAVLPDEGDGIAAAEPHDDLGPPLSTDHVAWRAAWAARAGDVPAGVRLRFGRPFGVRQVFEALADASSTPPDRALSHLEFHILTGVDALEPTDWVARQTAALAALAPRLEVLAASDSRWGLRPQTPGPAGSRWELRPQTPGPAGPAPRGR